MALTRLERGLQLNIQEHDTDVWYTAMNRRDLGRVYRSTSRPERATALFQLCLRYFESKLVPTDERLVGLLKDIRDLRSDWHWPTFERRKFRP